eukprot:TRINITY_DN5_c0_g2_i1.p1 TRINITY_DN5_c0_g2~~TRINITY_DN5_c0_g2_i1.p1  ORF type:complete len:159 (+),score=7.38 TRINITY_DN5_c0_g2_i1:186-662(+)
MCHCCPNLCTIVLPSRNGIPGSGLTIGRLKRPVRYNYPRKVTGGMFSTTIGIPRGSSFRFGRNITMRGMSKGQKEFSRTIILTTRWCSMGRMRRVSTMFKSKFCKKGRVRKQKVKKCRILKDSTNTVGGGKRIVGSNRYTSLTEQLHTRMTIPCKDLT